MAARTIPSAPYPLKDVPFAKELIETARYIVAEGRGILAADESTGTIGKRFAGINVENNYENRTTYRHALFTCPGELEKSIGGVICFEETLKAEKSGESLVSHLQKRGIKIGIKVDKGVRPLAGTAGETVTQGIDGLLERCQEYYKLGARFAKWRAVVKVDVHNGAPTENGINQNAYTLARYASICQQAGLVPIVEPEVLVLDGDQSIDTNARITQEVISACYRELIRQNVLLEGTLLKPNMVLAGKACPDQPDTATVARYTLRVLQNTVPPAVPGIVFLSGGMSEEQATVNLNALNLVDGPKPWALTFSFGRALQASALKAWMGNDANIPALQETLLFRAQANQQAALGQYKGDAASADAKASLYIENYKY